MFTNRYDWLHLSFVNIPSSIAWDILFCLGESHRFFMIWLVPSGRMNHIFRWLLSAARTLSLSFRLFLWNYFVVPGRGKLRFYFLFTITVSVAVVSKDFLRYCLWLVIEKRFNCIGSWLFCFLVLFSFSCQSVFVFLQSYFSCAAFGFVWAVFPQECRFWCFFLSANIFCCKKTTLIAARLRPYPSMGRSISHTTRGIG